MGGKDFNVAMLAHERAIESALGPHFHAPDIALRRDKMAESPFVFLRATCWRWASKAPELCPELMDLPAVPSVGDAHAGNFALWRDDQARLVWGISDYDEAARLPFALDLVRLCVSVKVAHKGIKVRGICNAALAGYRAGLDVPSPFILERDNLWLRNAFAADDVRRADFWADLKAAPRARPGKEFSAILRAALPDPDLRVRFARRSVGAGSLGRARFVALGKYRGGPLAVEAKASLPSCWPMGVEEGLAARMAAGPARSPDPSLCYGPDAVTRRLAPNSRKLDFSKIDKPLRTRLVAAMANELAAVHGETAKLRSRIGKLLDRLPEDWLEKATAEVSDWTEKEFSGYQKDYARGVLA